MRAQFMKNAISIQQKGSQESQFIHKKEPKKSEANWWTKTTSSNYYKIITNYYKKLYAILNARPTRQYLDGILLPNRYAGGVPKSNQIDSQKLQKHICLLVRQINSD